MDETIKIVHELAEIEDVDQLLQSDEGRWTLARLRMAYAMAVKSTDLSTRNGAVLFNPDGEVIGVGWNGILPGLATTPERLEQRPLKYQVIQHAEMSSITCAARNGNATEGASLYCPWYACIERCTPAIIESGVAEVVGHYDYFTDDGETVRNPRWDLSLAWQLLAEAGVSLRLVRGHLGIETFIDGETILL